ncbi:TRAP transporter large permease subunit [Amycolatopsis jiangsuensis]|uniref:TRAP-type C4-dicarboxylate transport system permease large subunit n=1 Tax=Amycolatopsis jiangsuensis TaxID=1181879 RepID=A0A840J480_9PSEU|nr:TRAP transporter large permease subunit [Amycolatopsis jiangsuensis]MBB4688222.1 TRAP-type C4-dicarboxylate transport system permease large subunit [Amycolatopsis jiangsuensis]
MGLAVWALIAYIAVIVVWNAVLKRSIGEAMILGFVVLCAFGTTSFPRLAWAGLQEAGSQNIIFAALAFTFIGSVLTRTGVVDRQVDILNSLLGRVRGGAGFVATVGSAAFGSVAHSGSANAATIGSVAIPWMGRSNWSPRIAATVVAGNAGNGAVIPPSASFFVLLGSGAVAPFVTVEQLFVAMFATAGWCVAWRLLCIVYFVRRYKIERVPASELLGFAASLRRGWTSLFVFVAIAVPIVLTFGAGGTALTSALGESAVDAIDILVWIPVLLGLVAAAIGRAKLPRTRRGWAQLMDESAPRFKDVGATLVFAFAGGAVLSELGLSDQLGRVLNGLGAPPLIAALIVGVIVILVAGPLSSTATMATVGGVAFAVLVTAGVHPVLAACSILVFSSTEGASPPGAAAIYISTSLAQVNPARTFVPLIIFYVVPFLFIGTAVALGILPVPH